MARLFRLHTFGKVPGTPTFFPPSFFTAVPVCRRFKRYEMFPSLDSFSFPDPYTLRKWCIWEKSFLFMPWTTSDDEVRRNLLDLHPPSPIPFLDYRRSFFDRVLLP